MNIKQLTSLRIDCMEEHKTNLWCKLYSKIENLSTDEIRDICGEIDCQDIQIGECLNVLKLIGRV